LFKLREGNGSVLNLKRNKGASSTKQTQRQEVSFIPPLVGKAGEGLT
jgi:hypothetical protein